MRISKLKFFLVLLVSFSVVPPPIFADQLALPTEAPAPTVSAESELVDSPELPAENVGLKADLPPSLEPDSPLTAVNAELNGGEELNAQNEVVQNLPQQPQPPLKNDPQRPIPITRIVNPGELKPGDMIVVDVNGDHKLDLVKVIKVYPSEKRSTLTGGEADFQQVDVAGGGELFDGYELVFTRDAKGELSYEISTQFLLEKNGEKRYVGEPLEELKIDGINFGNAKVNWFKINPETGDLDINYPRGLEQKAETVTLTNNMYRTSEAYMNFLINRVPDKFTVRIKGEDTPLIILEADYVENGGYYIFTTTTPDRNPQNVRKFKVSFSTKLNEGMGDWVEIGLRKY